jgi:hypothetical protein
MNFANAADADGRLCVMVTAFVAKIYAQLRGMPVFQGPEPTKLKSREQKNP